MIIIKNDMDFEVVIFPEDIKVAREKAFGTLEAFRENKDKGYLMLEGIAKNSGEKVIVEYWLHNKPQYSRNIEGRREGKENNLILKIYKDYFKFETNSPYDRGPIRNRYDGESKATIYSIFDLNDHLKYYFGITEAPPSN